MYILTRSLLITLGLTFAFAKWISVFNFLDLWKSIFSIAFLFVACYILYAVLTPDGNLFYMSFFPPFDSLGIHLAFPWHLLLMFAFIFVFQIVIYLPFFIYKSHKLKHGSF